MKITSALLLTLLLGTQANASTYRCAVEDADDYGVEVNFTTKKAAVLTDERWNVLEQMQIHGSMIPYFTGADANGRSLLIVVSPDEQTVSYDLNGQEVISRISCECSTQLRSGI